MAPWSKLTGSLARRPGLVRYAADATLALAREVAGVSALVNSPVMIGMAILQSMVNTRNPIEKIAAPMRNSCSVGVYS